METRREKKNIILKIPQSQWFNRKIKQVNEKVKVSTKRLRFRKHP
jgi:hypothetical protein